MNGSRSRRSDNRRREHRDPGIAAEIVTVINSLPALNSLAANNLIQYAKQVVEGLGGEEVKTQLYRVLSTLKRLERDFERGSFNREKVVLLKPGLVWAAYKHKKLRQVHSVVDAAIDKVTTIEDFQKLVKLVEAIVAYNAYGKPSDSEQGEGESA